MARKKVALPQLAAPPIRTVAELEDRLSEPTPGLVESMARLKGDLLILGAGGKIGPTLAQLAARAVQASGTKKTVTAVSAVFEPDARKRLERLGIKTIKAELLDPGVMDKLPDAENVVYMIGRKFGSTGAEWETWAANVLLAGLAAQRYKDSRVVAFSTGMVYPIEPVSSCGSVEETPMAPLGEYSVSCQGRERMFDYYAHHGRMKLLHFRLNYAVELRYGVIVDVALQVWNEEPVDLTMGHFNCAWQGYVNTVALQSLGIADSPPRILNVTGPETVSVRWLATRLGTLMGKKPHFVGEESGRAFLSNAFECHKLFGYPQVTVETVAEWVAHWIMSGGELLGKPTHYATSDGKY